MTLESAFGNTRKTHRILKHEQNCCLTDSTVTELWPRSGSCYFCFDFPGSGVSVLPRWWIPTHGEAAGWLTITLNLKLDCSQVNIITTWTSLLDYADMGFVANTVIYCNFASINDIVTSLFYKFYILWCIGSAGTAAGWRCGQVKWRKVVVFSREGQVVSIW